MTVREKEQIELNCREVRLVLGVMGLDKLTRGMKAEEIAAIQHYRACDACKKIGLSGMLQQELTCQEALEIYATKPGSINLFCGEDYTLQYALAVEHIWGRSVQTEDREYTDPEFGRCSEHSCVQLRVYWRRAPLCMFYDGEREVARELPLLLDFFLTQKWPLEGLLEIQRQRMNLLLTCLIAGRIPPDDLGHYHEPTDLVREIKENFRHLQEVVKNLLETQEM